MLPLNARWFPAAATVLAVLTVCTWAAEPAASAPPATQSSQTLFPEVPDDGAETRLPGGKFDFLRGDSSVGGVVEGSPSPQIGEYHGSRAVDLINRRRNWIYNAQSPPSFELSAERALGVRSASEESGSGDAGWLADFFHDRGAPETRRFDDALSESLQVPGLNNHVLGAAPGLGLLQPGDPLTPYQGAGIGGDPANRAPSGNAGGPGLDRSELSGVPSSVRELLASPGSVNPLAAGFDPINLRIDTTRQDLNPTLPDPLAGMNQTPRTLDSLLGQPVRSVSEGPPSFLDSFNTRMLGNSSLAPAVGPTPESRAAERPMGFGQFPTRKF